MVNGKLLDFFLANRSKVLYFSGNRGIPLA